MHVRFSWLAVLALGALEVEPAAALAQVGSRARAAALGVVADGKTDNTGVLQKALDAAGLAGGGVVDLPAGRLRIDGALSIPAGVTLQGTYRVPPNVSGKSAKPEGTVLLAFAGRGKPASAPFIRLAGSNAALSGLVVIYPEWKQTDVPPVPYPPCVESHDTENVGITECCFLNPYEAIKLVRAARHLVRNVTGYPSWRGLYVDECYDIGHIENIHFWPFGVSYNPDDPYCKWVNTQGVAYELARTDWQYVHNTFCFGYGVGYKFSASAAGSTNGNFLGLGADSCRRAVLVEQAQPPGLLITNGEFVGRWHSADSVCLEVGPEARGKVSLVNCSFWGPIDRCVWMRSPFGQFTASACHFVNWDNNGRGAPAIQFDAGKAIVQGCTFEEEGIAVLAGEQVRSVILTANQATSGFRVSNQAGQRVQEVANEPSPLNSVPEARAHYRLLIGAPGDAVYLKKWHQRERADKRTMRWSSAASRLCLPVMPGKRYTLTMEVAIPKQAESPDAGLYLDGRRLVALRTSDSSLVVELPSVSADHVTLELRCRGWAPKALTPGSNDDRTLGITAFGVVMKACDADPRVFDLNQGDWVGRRSNSLP